MEVTAFKVFIHYMRDYRTINPVLLLEGLVITLFELKISKDNLKLRCKILLKLDSDVAQIKSRFLQLIFCKWLVGQFSPRYLGAQLEKYSACHHGGLQLFGQGLAQDQLHTFSSKQKVL